MSIMHEFSIAQNIINIIKDSIGEEMLGRVNKIYMEIGKLAGVSTESLEFSLQVILNRRNQKVLDVKEIQPLVLCFNCKNTYPPEDMVWICPYCGEYGADILKGNEIKIIDVEVNDED